MNIKETLRVAFVIVTFLLLSSCDREEVEPTLVPTDVATTVVVTPTVEETQEAVAEVEEVTDASEEVIESTAAVSDTPSIEPPSELPPDFFSPSGSNVLYRSPEYSHNLEGLDLTVDHVRVAEKSALLFEQYAGSYLYAPDSWKSAATKKS